MTPERDDRWSTIIGEAVIVLFFVFVGYYGLLAFGHLLLQTCK